MTNFIFLDIDGVLVHNRVAKKEELSSGLLVPWSQVFMGAHFLGFPDPDCIKRVNDLAKYKPDTHVILSSTWRIGTPLNVNNAFLQKHGAEFDLRGQTSTNHSGKRGLQIKEYLDEWEAESFNKPNFVVLDDEVEDIRPVKRVFDKTVQVRNGWMEEGIQDLHIKKAKEILDGGV